MSFELTNEQRQLMAEHTGCPVEVVDPLTQRSYVLIPREEYERMRSLLGDVQEPGPKPPEARGSVPLGICRSQEALRRALPQLLAQRKLRGQWVCYAGNECIGIGRSKASLVRACVQRGLDDDAFYVWKIEPHELAEEEELGPPSPALMEEEGTAP